MSLGGVLGGAFNAFVAPAVFGNVWEYPIVLVLAALARPRAARAPGGEAWVMLGLWFVLRIIRGGVSAEDRDFVHAVYGNFPYVLGFVILLTYILLARAFRSLVLFAVAGSGVAAHLVVAVGQVVVHGFLGGGVHGAGLG